MGDSKTKTEFKELFDLAVNKEIPDLRRDK